MLQGGGDADVTVRVAVHEQQLNLPDRTLPDAGCGRVVDGLVAGNDARVVRRLGCVLVDV